MPRALAQQPQVLLRDEPTNHRDIHHQRSILSLVASLPVTSIIALHDLNQALDCDRLAVMERGRLVCVGTPGEVLTPQRLYETFAVRGSFLTDPADGRVVLKFYRAIRSEEHTSELQSLMRISYAVFCLKKKKTT